MIRGLDYSVSRPGGAAIKAAGFQFAARYLSRHSPKGLTAPERDDLFNNGVGIVLVWETYAQRANEGRSAGQADGDEALALAKGLSVPDGTPIYFAVDWDATAAQQANVDEYLRGAAATLGAARVGVYGGYRVCARCKENGSAAWFWQTYAWSGGQWLPEAHIRQVANEQFLNGCSIDHDEAWQPAFGLWTPTPLPSPQQPAVGRYTIQAGDTFWGLEAAHHWPHGTLQLLNPAQDPASLQVGQQINVPAEV